MDDKKKHIIDLLKTGRQIHFTIIIACIVFIILFGNLFLTVSAFNKDLKVEDNLNIEIKKNLKIFYNDYFKLLEGLEKKAELLKLFHEQLNRFDFKFPGLTMPTMSKENYIKTENEWIADKAGLLAGVKSITKSDKETGKVSQTIPEAAKTTIIVRYIGKLKNALTKQIELDSYYNDIMRYSENFASIKLKNRFLYSEEKLISRDALIQKLIETDTETSDSIDSLLKSVKVIKPESVLKKGYRNKRWHKIKSWNTLSKEYKDAVKNIDNKKRLAPLKKKAKQVLLIHQHIINIKNLLDKDSMENVEKYTSIDRLKKESLEKNITSLLNIRERIINEVKHSVMEEAIKKELNKAYTVSGFSIESVHILPTATIILSIMMFWLLVQMRQLRSEVDNFKEKIYFVWFGIYRFKMAQYLTGFTLWLPATIGSVMVTLTFAVIRPTINRINSDGSMVSITSWSGLSLLFAGTVVLIVLAFISHRVINKIREDLNLNVDSK